MNRTHGSIGTLPIECINKKYNKYRIRWDFQPSYETDKQNGVTFFEAEINHKPSIDEIKEIVLEGYNKEIDKKIVSGFVWKDMPIWLSFENQFNYKAAYDLAVTFGGNLPCTFKFGTMLNPVYYEFTNTEDLTDFYLSAMNYINNTLAEGWKEKDNIDWSIYNIE